MRRITFDEQIIGAKLPDEWRILGTAASVKVAPFPDPFDRSLQVISASASESTAACYKAGDATSISVDVLSDAPAGMLISLRDLDNGAELGVAIGADGSVLLQPGNTRLGDAVVDPDEWYHVTFAIDAAGGSVTVSAEPRDAIGSTAAQASVQFDWSSVDARPELCVASPRGAGAAAFLDNVTVE